MSVIKKPDLKIFAQEAKTGEIETFPDVLRGWGITLERTAGKPPLEWFNAIGKRADEWLMYLTQRGVAEWDTTLSYPKTAIVQFNNQFYVAIKETKSEQPDKSQASWSTLGVFLGLGNYYTKTDADIKFQPKGNYALDGDYQPAGDYATNAALNNGLALKFDKTGGTISGVVNVQRNIQATGEVASRDDDDMLSMKTANVSTLGPHFVSKRKSTNTYRTHSLPDKTGTLMQVGDCGFGGNGSGTGLWVNWTSAQVENFFKTGVSSIWRNQQETTPYAARYGASFYVRSSDTFWNMNVNHASGDVLISNGLTGQAPSTFKIAKLFSTLNTTSDRNGCLRIANASTELSDYQVGVPLPWPQATAPVGYLICNGQWFNKTNYPLLAKAYPSGQLPDLRSEFIRGLDAGRNIDTSRGVLTLQSDAIRNITGRFSVLRRGGGYVDVNNGPFVIEKNWDGRNGSGGGDDWGSTFLFDASKVVPTANENRPRNIAFLYIVRAA